MSSVYHYYVSQVKLGKRKSSDTDSTKSSKRKSSIQDTGSIKNSRKKTLIQEPAVIAYQPGQFVAMCCEKYKEYKPQIAKINKVNGSVGTVNIVWLDGTYDSKWKIWKIGGRIIKDTVPLRAILTEVELSSDMCISKKLKSELDEKYCSAEYV